jgi:hypothetical protein
MYIKVYIYKKKYKITKSENKMLKVIKRMGKIIEEGKRCKP